MDNDRGRRGCSAGQADVNRRFSRDERLVIADQLVKEVKRYVDAVPLPAMRKQKIKPLQITFRTLEGNEGVAPCHPKTLIGCRGSIGISRLSGRRWKRQREYATIPANGEFIEELAIEVMKAPDGTLGRKAIETILGLA